MILAAPLSTKSRHTVDFDYRDEYVLMAAHNQSHPDIHKMAILADVAPYSREYHNARQRVVQQAQGDTELEIEYEKIRLGLSVLPDTKHLARPRRKRSPLLTGLPSLTAPPLPRSTGRPCSPFQ